MFAVILYFTKTDQTRRLTPREMLAKSQTSTHNNEIKDQQCKATIRERKPQHNPTTPAGHPEGTERKKTEEI
jgi:hypothetical protein